MKVKRVFTEKNNDPYWGVNFVKRTSQIKKSNSLDSEVVEMIAPENWSQVAVDIVSHKYRRKKGVPKLVHGENDIRLIFERMAQCWSKWGLELGLIQSKDEAKIFADEIKFMLVHQMAAPNSPQWFNTGLFDAYGIKGRAQGHFYVDPKEKSLSKRVKKSTSSYERPQPHACFIQSVEDHLVGPGGIMDLWQREALLFKFGSGTGTNFSRLREKGAELSSGGTTSGLMEWLKIGDRAASAIKSGGTTRRAAKMVCLDIDHPEIVDFITWKVDEEEKLAAMVAGHKLILSLKEKKRRGQLTSKDLEEAKRAGVPEVTLSMIDTFDEGKAQHRGLIPLNTDWQGEGYDTISGQNANNSVRVPDPFFKALDEDRIWPLIDPINGNTVGEIKAKDLWQLIAESAWKSADPGVQYSTTINSWHTCPVGGEIRASNPCSEYLFLDDSACNLASINLVAFENDEGFDTTKFRHACRLWTMVLEISVEMAQYPSAKIAENSIDYRTLGLGFANLGGLIMRRGFSYDSDEARSFAGAIAAILGGEAYLTSSEMAKTLGHFRKYEENKESVIKVLKRHRQNLRSTQDNFTPLWSEAAQVWDEVIKKVSIHGLRNAQVSAIAPTGTIGLLMDCDTTGVEPDYSLIKHKSLSGGGDMSLVNQSVPIGLKRLGFNKKQIQEIVSFIEINNSVQGAPYLNEDQKKVFDCAVGFPSISVDGHLLMMAAIQPFISGGISKTINLPHDTTIEKIKEVYELGYKLGLKSLAVYRNNSKLSQPLQAQEKYGSCPFCGLDKLRRTGSCFVCENCGESTSCG